MLNQHIPLHSEGREIESDDDRGWSGNVRGSRRLWPGDCLVRVTPWVKCSGQFDIGANDLDAERKSASPLDQTLRGPREAGVGEAGEVQDYLRIGVTEPTAAVFYPADDLDMASALGGANGREYASNDDGSEHFTNFRIAVILLRLGECRLRVYSPPGSVGNYMLYAERLGGSPCQATAPRDTESPCRVKAVLVALRLASACEEALKCVAYTEGSRDRVHCLELRACELCVSLGEVGNDYKSIVKSRLEQSWMGWTVDGASAIPAWCHYTKSSRYEKFLSLSVGRKLRESQIPDDVDPCLEGVLG